jgi:glycosyltransferase involved in cell wall biosynthesis
MQKKLIYVLNSYASNEASHFAHLTHLLQEMAQQGCEITLVIEKMHAQPPISSAGISVLGLRRKMPLVRHIELFFVILRLIRNGYTRSFYRINAPACIIGALAHSILGGETYLWQSGTTHEVDWAQPIGVKKLTWWLGSYLPNWLARRMTTYFVTGPEKMVTHYNEVVGIPRNKIRLLYNDIQIDRFADLSRAPSRSAYLASRNLPADTVVLLIVHRLSPVRKTTSYLLPLLKALKKSSTPWHLIVAGGGSELVEAIRISQQTGAADCVDFMGDIPNRNLPTVYAQADLFLQPSYTEGFPRVMLEAMAASLPIVSTDAGGTEQLVGPLQAHYVVRKESPEDFVAATIKLMSRREEWGTLGQENRKTVERFSTPVVAGMYLETLFP